MHEGERITEYRGSGRIRRKRVDDNKAGTGKVERQENGVGTWGRKFMR